MVNPNGESGSAGEAGVTARLETRLPATGGLYAWLFSASGAERFIM